MWRPLGPNFVNKIIQLLLDTFGQKDSNADVGKRVELKISITEGQKHGKTILIPILEIGYPFSS